MIDPTIRRHGVKEAPAPAAKNTALAKPPKAAPAPLVEPDAPSAKDLIAKAVPASEVKTILFERAVAAGAELAEKMKALTPAEAKDGKIDVALHLAMRAFSKAERPDVSAVLGSLLSADVDAVAAFAAQDTIGHLDPAYDLLKKTAARIDALRAPADPALIHYNSALASLHAQAHGQIASYAKELDAFVKAKPEMQSALLQDIAAMPKDEATAALLFHGADDIEQAHAWLLGLKHSSPALTGTIASHAKGRLATARAMQQEHVEPTQPVNIDDARSAVAKMLLSYPALASSALPALGLSGITTLPPEGEPPASLSSEEKAFWQQAQKISRTHAMEELGLAVAETAGGLAVAGIPLVGQAVAVVAGSGASIRDLMSAYDTADKARVQASAGLVTRAHAERLDDDIALIKYCAAATLAIAVLGVSIKPKAIVALAKNSKNLGEVVSNCLRALVHNPDVGAVVLGATSSLFGADALAELEAGEYDKVAKRAVVQAATGVVFGRLAAGGLRMAGWFRSKATSKIVPMQEALATPHKHELIGSSSGATMPKGPLSGPPEKFKSGNATIEQAAPRPALLDEKRTLQEPKAPVITEEQRKAFAKKFLNHSPPPEITLPKPKLPKPKLPKPKLPKP